MNKLFSARIEKLLTRIPLVENLACKKRGLFRKDDQELLCQFDNWIWKLIRIVRIKLARYQYFIKIIG